jgi:hypothetical protein
VYRDEVVFVRFSLLNFKQRTLLLKVEEENLQATTIPFF